MIRCPPDPIPASNAKPYTFMIVDIPETESRSVWPSVPSL